jgi:hypothetical protein
MVVLHVEEDQPPRAERVQILRAGGRGIEPLSRQPPWLGMSLQLLSPCLSTVAQYVYCERDAYCHPVCVVSPRMLIVTETFRVRDHICPAG